MPRQPKRCSIGSKDHRDRQQILALEEPFSKLKPKGASPEPNRAAQPQPASSGRALTAQYLMGASFARRLTAEHSLHGIKASRKARNCTHVFGKKALYQRLP